MEFICMVKITANLRLIVLIISCMSWVLDFGNVCALCNIGRRLNDSTIGSDVWNDALHKLELWDIPIINWPISLSHLSTSINY